MPRSARKILDASFFHVIIQGINKEFIFKEERFKNQYLKEFNNNIKDTNIDIIAYCIMDNHAHFFVKDRKDRRYFNINAKNEWSVCKIL